MDEKQKIKYENIVTNLFFWMLKFVFIVAVITFAFIIFGTYVFNEVGIIHCNETIIIKK